MLTIDKSREILGDKYSECSDKEIEKIRDVAYMFADIFLEDIVDAREVFPNTKI